MDTMVVASSKISDSHTNSEYDFSKIHHSDSSVVPKFPTPSHDSDFPIFLAHTHDSDSLRQRNEIWLFQSMENLANSKNLCFKKTFNTNCIISKEIHNLGLCF